jgi:hypothetical protein
MSYKFPPNRTNSCECEKRQDGSDGQQYHEELYIENQQDPNAEIFCVGSARRQLWHYYAPEPLSRLLHPDGSVSVAPDLKQFLLFAQSLLERIVRGGTGYEDVVMAENRVAVLALEVGTPTMGLVGVLIGTVVVSSDGKVFVS